MKRHITLSTEVWPLANPFIIARNKRIEVPVVKLAINAGGFVGHGESTPSTRYGETPGSVVAQIKQIIPLLEEGLTRQSLQYILPAGAARNAVDSALWDLEAKTSNKPVSQLTGLSWPTQITTVQTISILSPEEMGREARLLKGFPMIKIKVNGERIIERIRAVHENLPDAKLLIDANESWNMEILKKVAPDLKALGVIFIEQPLPAGQDQELAEYNCPLPLGADESCHTRADLDYLKGKYDIINIKLDKAGGLTEAIALMKDARTAGFDIMVGCMLATSLGIAPGMFLATKADFTDLDAPALLAKDRKFGLTITQGSMSPLNPKLWGGTT